MTMGQFPEGAPSLLVTVILASEEQLSEMVNPSASSAATVLTAAGISLASHPSTVVMGREPIKNGGELSLTVITCVQLAAGLPQSSVAV